MLFWFNKSASSISARINEPYPFNPRDKKVNKVFDVINTQPCPASAVVWTCVWSRMLRQERQSALSYLRITKELLREKGASF